MNSLLLTGGRVIDPANHLDAVGDVLILEGKVAALAPNRYRGGGAGRIHVRGLHAEHLAGN